MGCEFRAIVHTKSATKVGHVLFYRLIGDSHLARNLLVGLTSTHANRNVGRSRRKTSREYFDRRGSLLKGTDRAATRIDLALVRHVVECK